MRLIGFLRDAFGVKPILMTTITKEGMAYLDSITAVPDKD